MLTTPTYSHSLGAPPFCLISPSLSDPLGSMSVRTPLFSPPLLSLHEGVHAASKLRKQGQVDSLGHGLVPGRVQVQVVARVVLGVELRRIGRVPDGGIEVDNSIEPTTALDPLVDAQALGLDGRLAVRLARPAARRDGRAEDGDAEPVQASDHLVERGDEPVAHEPHLRLGRRRSRGAAEVVDALVDERVPDPACATTSRSMRPSALGPSPSASTRLPPAASLTTATTTTEAAPVPVLASDCRRAASWSGQRSLPLVVLPRPSVMLSPTMTREPNRDGSHASMPVRKYQWSVFWVSLPLAMSAAPARLPGPMWLVVRLPGWPVMRLVVCPSARYMVTVRTCWAARVMFTGSEKTTAPLGTVKEGLPEKVTFWRVSGSMALAPAAPLAGRATVTAVMGRSEPPKTLLNCNLMFEAFCVTDTVCLSVAF